MRTLTLRLALLLLAIVAGAVGLVYLYVVPPLSNKLRDEELAHLAVDAQRYAPEVQTLAAGNADAATVAKSVRSVAATTGARVTLLGINHTTAGLQTDVRADSSGGQDIRDLQFAPALAAAGMRRTATGSEASDAGRIGEAAVPLYFVDSRGRRLVGYALVLSTPLDDVDGNVALVRHRFLAAGGIALVLALIAALVVAMRLGRRVERLRDAARRVAAGDFSARFAADSRDEIGLLANELDDMRLQLAELDEARSRFIATASHELRTPIFSLGGFLELLADEEVDDETRAQFLDQLRGQVGRLQKLATALLDLSKLEAGSLDLRPERTDVGVLTRAVVGEFTPALAARDSHLNLRLAFEPMAAVCDPERVAQILRILVDNALTHTPPGTDMVVSASVSAPVEQRAGEAGGHRLRLTVLDFGGGIHRTVLPHVFEPFYTSDDAQGSGLGLAIARELAERMDGELGVATAGGTTTFTLEVPA